MGGYPPVRLCAVASQRPKRCLGRSGRRTLSLRGDRLSIAQPDQFLLKLSSLVDRHNWFGAWRRQIFDCQIGACFRRHRRFCPRIHQR
jgi:hypothetical protein